MSESVSKNERAEALMGRRETGGIAFDLPVELGYWCPVCRVASPDEEGRYDERLHWSEYQGFLWCEVCNKDYPSALCVPLDTEPDEKRPWVFAGVDGAIEVFLGTIEDLLHRVASPSPDLSEETRSEK